MSTLIARRIALLSTSSLGLAAIVSAASLGMALTPTAALAANECGNPAANGTTPDVFVCPVATYPTGIQHTSAGDLDLTLQVGSTLGTGGMVTSAGGSAANTDDLTVRIARITGTATSASFNTAFPRLIDVQSQTGDILVDFTAARPTGGSFFVVNANNAVTTHGIYAVSQAGGDVIVRRTAATNGEIQATGAASIAAIEARSIGGGDVTVEKNASTIGPLTATGGQHGIWAVTDGAGDVSITANGTGRLYGIRAQAGGTGTVTVTGSGSTSGSTGLYGIHATTNAGLLTITGSGSSSATAGTGVYIDAGGDVDFTGTASGGQYGIYVNDVLAGTTTTINLTGNATGGAAGIFAQGDGELFVNVVNSLSSLNFNFNGMAAPVLIDFSGDAAWRPTAGASVIPAGNFTVHIGADGALIAVPFSSETNMETPVVLTFADPSFTLVNEGYIVVGPDNTATNFAPATNEAELRLVGLNEFRNAGTIMMGGLGYRGQGLLGVVRIQSTIVSETDAWYDDMLVFENGTWIGEGGRVVFDADLGRTQTSCTREAVTFNFGAADCLRIINSTVEGVTLVDVRDIFAADRGRLNQEIMDDGITLIETPGSTVDATNFVLDPEMDGYNAGALDKGLFQYVLLFDEDAEQFRLFGTLSGAAYQLPMAATAAHNMWRLSTGSWLNRQADLRGGAETGFGGGVWLRASGEQTDREVTSLSTLGGLPFATDNSHRADTYAITGGLDLLSASYENMAYVLGVTAGYAHTDIGYGASANTQAMDAWSGGLYGSVITGSLFVDAVVNANNVIIDTDAPGLGLQPEGTILSSRMISLGGQVEAGWRLLFDGGFFAEPLAAVSYVRSKMDELQIQPDDFSRPGLEVSFEDPSSFRAGVGARFGVDTNLAGMRTQASLLARTWQDLEGQNTAVIHNLAYPDDEPIRVVDEFSDQFHEVAVGASLWAPNGVVSGFLNLGGKWGEGYEAKTGSLGVRVAW